MIIYIRKTESVFLCCFLPDDADIVLGFVKVGGGPGLLSMIVPEAQRSFIIFYQKN